METLQPGVRAHYETVIRCEGAHSGPEVGGAGFRKAGKPLVGLDGQILENLGVAELSLFGVHCHRVAGRHQDSPTFGPEVIVVPGNPNCRAAGVEGGVGSSDQEVPSVGDQWNLKAGLPRKKTGPSSGGHKNGVGGKESIPCFHPFHFSIAFTDSVHTASKTQVGPAFAGAPKKTLQDGVDIEDSLGREGPGAGQAGGEVGDSFVDFRDRNLVATHGAVFAVDPFSKLDLGLRGRRQVETGPIDQGGPGKAIRGIHVEGGRFPRHSMKDGVGNGGSQDGGVATR